MRRRLAYIILTLSLFLGVAATIGPSITNMDTDVSYGSGQDLYFRLFEKNSTVNGTVPGVNSKGDGEPSYIDNDSYVAVDAVSKEFESRLESWGVNGTVTKEGFDTVKVSIRAQNADATGYTYLENYLSFSGQNITVGVGTMSQSILDKAPGDDSYLNNSMFEGQKASISYVNSVPVVTIPVNHSGKDGKFDKLVQYCKDNTKSADSSTGEAATNCYLVLWNNFQEGDTYAKATETSSANYDSNMAKRLIFGENASNAWYVDNDNSDNDYKEFELVPNSDAINNGSYDSSKAGAAYKAAFYYMHLLNASSYDYDVTFAYAAPISASTEALVSAGDWHLSPTFGATLIAALASLVLGLFVIALFYHLGVLAVASNVAIAVEGAVLLLGYFSAQFGIGTFIGLWISALVTAFGGIYYFAKFKEELYQGRTPKKAHQEAIRKSLWPTLDVGILSLIAGLCVYAWVPSIAGKIGLALVFGAFFGTAANLVLLRLEGWLLANDGASSEKYPGLYFVDRTKVPNPLKEEKQSYFGPYAKTNFQKHWKLTGVIASALLIASIVGISAFSIISGSAYNYANAYSDTTSISIDYCVDSGTTETLVMYTEDQVETNFLPKIELNGVAFGHGDYSDIVSNIVLEKSTVFSSENSTSYDVYYFDVYLSQYFDPQGTYKFTVVGDPKPNSYSTLSAAVIAVADLYTGVTAEANTIQGQVGAPALSTVYLALGVASIFEFVYLFLRFKASRGLALALLSFASGLFVVGFFALTRISVTPLVSIGAIVVSFLTLLFGAFILNKEREIVKESRERDKSSASFRELCLKEANAQSAGDLVVFALLSLGCLILCYGFAPSVYHWIFLGMIVGTALSTIFVLILLCPLSICFARLFARIHISFPKLRGKQKPVESGKRRTSEPEEAVFIGIND